MRIEWSESASSHIVGQLRMQAFTSANEEKQWKAQLVCAQSENEKKIDVAGSAFKNGLFCVAFDGKIYKKLNNLKTHFLIQ